VTASVPSGLRASLALVPPGAPFALLIRHADREEFRPGELGDHIELTAIGEERSRALAKHGAIESCPALWGESSPLPRCMSTARHIGVSAASNPLLGKPGAFVTDAERAGEAFLRLGTGAVVRGHLAGEGWPFMRSPEEGARLLLADIAARLAARRGAGLFISHDSVVMPVIAWVAGERFEDTWLAPLDGIVVLQVGGSAVRVLWQGRSFDTRP
jgi:Histidine phosphatase superfamily (branch 1)